MKKDRQGQERLATRGRRWLPVALALGLAGCVTPGPQLGVAEIDKAERDGQLETLFEQLSSPKSGLAALAGNNAQQLVLVGSRLADREARQLRADLEKLRPPSRFVPLKEIDGLRARAEKIKRWDGARHQALLADLDGERRRTEAEIQTRRTAIGQLTEADHQRRLALLAEIATLGGSGSPDEQAFRRQTDETKGKLYLEGTAAYQNRQYELAERTLQTLREIDPGYREVGKYLALARLPAVEKTFKEPQSDEQLVAAFQRLFQLNELFPFERMAAEVTPTLQGLRGHYLALAAAAVTEERLAEAYQALENARRIAGLAGIQGGAPEEAAFVERLRQRIEQAGLKQQAGLMLGFLNMVEELQADFPQLKKTVRETKDRIYDKALKRVGTSNFTKGNEAYDKQGASVTAKIAQSLFQALPQDIRLVERDQLQAVLREQEILALQNKTALNISSADYLIQGSILESSVETDEKKGRKVMRVKTGVRRKANPAFSEWQARPEAERQKQQKPEEEVVEPVLEDVAINITAHRKVGLLGVAYRLVESASSKVLFTDSLTLKRSAEGESSDAVQIGEFVQPFKVAELPSDGEMLELLASEVTQKISVQLTNQLKGQEVAYQALAARAAKEENFLAAAEFEAAALVIAEHKGFDVRPYQERLCAYALQAPLNP